MEFALPSTRGPALWVVACCLLILVGQAAGEERATGTDRPELLPRPQIPAALVGRWTQRHSEYRFAADGTVSINFARKRRFLTDFTSSHSARLVTSVRGHFEAKADLIFVTWNDGSRLNYRWRRDAEQLFLTDHIGRVTPLSLHSEGR